MEARIEALREQFHTLFGEKEARVWSAPGRTEIGGNHTDHQLGKVVAASVDMDMLAAAAKNGTNVVNVKSEGYDMISFTLDTLTPVKAEEGTTLSLIRGICAEAAARGFQVGGFDACITSNVLQGSGLSSSAAFEVLIGAVVNGLFCESTLTATDLAIMGQKAENVFYGKPCGLMDEMASAWGGIIAIDFKDPAAPVVTPVDFDFASAHHSLCMINLRSDHADLSDEYAAIPGELRKISAHFGKKALREVDEAAFYKAMPELRKEAGDRAVLRAVHIFNENRRVDRIVEASPRCASPGVPPGSTCKTWWSAAARRIRRRRLLLPCAKRCWASAAPSASTAAASAARCRPLCRTICWTPSAPRSTPSLAPEAARSCISVPSGLQRSSDNKKQPAHRAGCFLLLLLLESQIVFGGLGLALLTQHLGDTGADIFCGDDLIALRQAIENLACIALRSLAHHGLVRYLGIGLEDTAHDLFIVKQDDFTVFLRDFHRKPSFA